VGGMCEILFVQVEIVFDSASITAVNWDNYLSVYLSYSCFCATLKNDLSLHNLTFEDAIEMALDKPMWGLLAASGATH